MECELVSVSQMDKKNKNKREIKNELAIILREPLINLQTKVCEWGTLKYMNKVH